MNPRKKKPSVSSTLKRLRTFLDEFPDKKQFTINENSYDLVIGCHIDGTEYRRAYLKFDFMKMGADGFRKVLDELRNANTN